MNLLCRFGWHSARPLARWNDGYYFSQCRRCGCDLVRTSFGDWRVPEGYRIVWSVEPPPGREEAKLVEVEEAPAVAAEAPLPEPEPEPQPEPQPEPAPLPEPEEPAAAEPPLAAETPVSEPERPKLPIEEVLTELRNAPAPEPQEQEPEQEPASPRPKPRFSWDFMDDDASEDWSPPRQPQSVVQPAGADPAPREEPAAEATGSQHPAWFGGAAAMGSARWPVAALIGLSLFLGTALVVLVIATVSVRQDRSVVQYPPQASVAAAPEPAPALPAAEAAPARAPAGEAAYVAASLLSCRAAPALQAKRVRNLARGDQVRLLSKEGDWASIAHRGGQCWAQARYISPAQPL